MEAKLAEKIYECEVRTWGTDPQTGKRIHAWITLSVEKARQLADVTIRCKECHGPIRLHSPGPHNIPKAHAEHRQRFRGCSLGDCFDGQNRLSPTPIE
jgi:uncharacterized protein with PIN domain